MYKIRLIFLLLPLLISCDKKEVTYPITCESQSIDVSPYDINDTTSPVVNFDININSEDNTTENIILNGQLINDINVSKGDSIRGLFIAEDRGAGIRMMKVEKGYQYFCVDNNGDETEFNKTVTLVNTRFSNESEPGVCITASDTLTFSFLNLGEDCALNESVRGVYSFLFTTVNWHSDTVRTEIKCSLE